MNVLVTGGAGYIGSQMVRQLLEKDYSVVVFDNLTAGHKAAIPQNAKLVVGDFLDKAALDALFSSHKFDAVMHFAGVISMGESMENPSKYFAINTAGALNLLDAMVKSKVDKLIFSSTAGVYGNPVQIPIKEEDPKDPTNPYGESKLAVERTLSWYDRIHNLRSISLRYFNAAGATSDGSFGEDHKEETHIIPLAIEAILSKKPFTLYGNNYQTKDGTCIRDYVHVIDLCDAHLLALQSLTGGHKTDAFNVGPGIGYSNNEVVEMIKKVTSVDLTVEIGDRRPGDADELIADATKIKTELSWNPRFSDLETIVKTAWQWHKTHPNGYES